MQFGQTACLLFHEWKLTCGSSHVFVEHLAEDGGTGQKIPALPQPAHMGMRLPSPSGRENEEGLFSFLAAGGFFGVFFSFWPGGEAYAFCWGQRPWCSSGISEAAHAPTGGTKCDGKLAAAGRSASLDTEALPWEWALAPPKLKREGHGPVPFQGM